MDRTEFAERLKRLKETPPAEAAAGRPSSPRSEEHLNRARGFQTRVVREAVGEFARGVRASVPKGDDADPRMMTCDCEFGTAARRGMIRVKMLMTGDGVLLVDFFLEPGHSSGGYLVLTPRDLDPARDEEHKSQIRDRLLRLYERHLRRPSRPTREPAPRASGPVPTGAC